MTSKMSLWVSQPKASGSSGRVSCPRAEWFQTTVISGTLRPRPAGGPAGRPGPSGAGRNGRGAAAGSAARSNAVAAAGRGEQVVGLAVEAVHLLHRRVVLPAARR